MKKLKLMSSGLARRMAPLAALLVLAALASVGWGQQGDPPDRAPAADAETATDTDAETATDADPKASSDNRGQQKSGGDSEKPQRKPFRGRLPAYYGHVVDEDQRQAIYGIQAEYAPRIAELRAQLEALLNERNARVAAVLTPEQLKKVEQLRADARAKRAEKAASKR